MFYLDGQPIPSTDCFLQPGRENLIFRQLNSQDGVQGGYSDR
jgi:hypothetical protein